MGNDKHGNEGSRDGDLATCDDEICAEARTISLLLIEADAEEACRLQAMLSQTAGLFVIKRVEQLQTALEYLAQGGNDVVLADLSLAEGPEAVASICRCVPGVPVVMLVDDGSFDVNQLLSTGADDVLEKRKLTGYWLAHSLTAAIMSKKVERESAHAREFFQAVIENSTDGVLVIDASGTVRYDSPSLHGMLGWGVGENVGTSGFDFIHPDDLPAALDSLSKMLPQPGSQTRLKMRVKHKDGTWRNVDVVATNRINDPAVKGVVVNLHDITERRKADEVIRTSEQKFRMLFEGANDGFVYVGLDGKIKDINSQVSRTLGYEKKDVVGRSVFELGSFSTEDMARLTEMFAGVLVGKEGIPDLIELNVRGADGRDVPVEASSRVVVGEGGAEGVLAIVRDITERKRLENELRELAEALSAQNVELEAARQELSELNQNLEQKVKERTAEVENLLKHKDQFISQLGHDLKSPLTPLVALLPIVRDDLQDPEQREMIDVAITNVNFMRELVTKTLRLARLNSARNGPVTGRAARVREPLDAVVRGRKPVADSKKITMETLVEDNIVVQLEDLDLQELFDHTINNAIKFTPEGGRITIDAVVSEPFVTVSVKDTGIGMTSDQLSHLFEEFYKADPSRHELDSSGLGLSICKRIVERAGGKMWAESEGLSKGSTFFFTLKLGDS